VSDRAASIDLGSFSAEQRAAVEHQTGPVCIVAGPGSGKTRTLTARIAYLLLEKHVPASDIVALTFTNKAAHEMRERVAAQIGDRTDLPLICTFHALARNLLQNEKAFADEPTRMEIVRELIKSRNLKGRSARDLALDISKAKNAVHPTSDSELKTLTDTYNHELSIRDLQDFDDLLIGLHDALQQGVLAQKQRYQYILVDEFQDTNDLQYAILQQLDTTRNMLVIGDPLQSIYGFRGASAAIFDQFERDWPGAERITLGTNYRSVPEIVHVANALFPEVLELQAHRHDHGKAQLIEVLNEYGEADWIVHEIERQIGGSDMLRSQTHHTSDGGRTFSAFAVLYRTHAAAKQLQKSLDASGIPYQVAGEGSPYLTPEVQAVLQALSYVEGRTETPEAKGFTSSQLLALLAPLRLQAPQPELADLASQVIKTLGLSYEKHDSLRKFTNALLAYKDKPLGEYLDHIASMAEQAYYDPQAEAVSLLTIHAAKGLEFPTVFLLGVEEGMLPHVAPNAKHPGAVREPKHHAQPQHDAEYLREEKRLFYVAVTRARDELYLLHARARHKTPQTVSSFITDLPKGTLTYVTDPDLANQQQKIKRRALKRAQGSLF